MKYLNNKTGLKIDLSSLSDKERGFYEDARARFREGMDWLDFEGLVLSTRNPAFARDRSHSEPLKHPLYLALKDMVIELGIEQGKIRRKQEDDECVEERGKARAAHRPRARSAKR